MSSFTPASSVLLIAVLLVSLNCAPWLCSASSGPHISDVNILLPPKMTNPVEYKLQASDGCFKWSWDHHDILSVHPEYNSSSHCSTSARLRSIAPYNGRKETAVYATDAHTGTVVRCKVYIDNFSRIQIFHNSIKLDLDGLSTLRVRAFDSEENLFSSLVGLQFMWQLMPEANGLAHHLVHVPLKDSPLTDCGGLCGDLDIQIKLEDSGVFSDLYVVKGTGIGHETVSVHLLEPPFESMSDKIVFTVAEAMSLDPPSPVLVLIGATVHYSLRVIRANMPQVVNLPSPFHRWSIVNSTVAQVDEEMGSAHALSLGVTSVTVEDTRVAGHAQMSSLHVVLPDTLSLYLLPLSPSGDYIDGINPIPSVSRWYTVTGRNYLVQMRVFAPGPWAQEIHITESDDVKLHDDNSGLWNTNIIPDNFSVRTMFPTSRILETTSCGRGKLTATLTYRTGSDMAKEVLKVVQEVMVCDQVRFSFGNLNVSESILLPWAPSIYQELDLNAAGGCANAPSDFKWSSSDISTVSISAYGIVQAKKPGRAVIKVESAFDPFNYDEVLVEVSIPYSMDMLPNFPVETIVGSHLPAAVTMKASNGAYFHKCDAFSSFVKWKAGSESFTIGNMTRDSIVFDMQFGPPCAWTHVFASSSGHTLLHATFSKENQQSGPIVLKTSLQIAAYPPLILHQIGQGNQFGGYWFDLAQAEASEKLENLEELYLVPGTNLDVMLRGGPVQWGHGVEFIESVLTLDENGTPSKDEGVLHHSSRGSEGAYRISCQKLGTYRLVFKRGNLVGDAHPLPAIEEVELLLRCSYPAAIVVMADEPVHQLDTIWRASQADRSPERIRATAVSVANGRAIRLSAVGISDSGKAFGNSSSLYLTWELSDCADLASWDSSYDLTTSKSSWDRFLVLHNASGLCIVRATVTGLLDKAGSHVSSVPVEIAETVLTDAIRLQLVSTLRVDPEYSLLFFSADAQFNLSVKGGSCFLDAVVNNSQVVQVTQSPSGSQCSLLVLAPKGLGTALVTVYDIALSPPLDATSVVQVADVDWVKITSPDKLSLMEGSLQSIELLAGIAGGSTFDSSQYLYMKIRVHIEDPVVELVDSDGILLPADGYVKAPNFVIRGRHIGITTLYVSAQQQSGREILSQTIKVEVYAPPELHPSDIFLVPGASYVLTIRGGPTIGAYVEYASIDDRTATINRSSGRLSAVSLGNATVVATVYGNGNNKICQAQSQVKVGIPSSAAVNVQSDQLAVGREMPTFPSFSEGNLFSFYELCKNYRWTINDEKILSFGVDEHMHAGKKLFGAHINGKDSGGIEVLYGRSAGRTEVAVTFTCNFVSDSFSLSRAYSASTSIWVVADLPLALGAPATWVLPPHYTSSNLLPSYSNSYDQFDTQNRKGAISYSLMRHCGGKNGEVQDDAISINRYKIRTMESNDDIACIVAKDRTSGRVEVASCIRVAEVSQIRITTKELRKIDLAVGAELDLPISYRDIIGLPFHEAYNAVTINAETNYPDIISINVTSYGNGNINIKAKQRGRALVQVSLDSQPQKLDYMMVSVGASVYPQNPVLHVGSRLNFSVEGENDVLSGQWFSGNGSILSVGIKSGIAEAKGEGTTQVMYEGPDWKLQTTVEVLEGNALFIDAPMDMLTNTPFLAREYRFPLKFSDAYISKHGAASRNSPILYYCNVDPPFIGHAKPWKDLDSGILYCLLFPYSPENLARSVPKSKEIGHELPVTVSVFLKEENNIAASVSALFIGGFSVPEMDENSMQLSLTGSNSSIISIIGNTEIEVEWNNRAQLIINSIHREGFGIRGRAQYEVKAVGDKKFTDILIFTLPTTGQRVEIDVIYEPVEETSTSTSQIVWWIIATFAILGASIAIYVAFLGDDPRGSRPSVLPGTPNVAAPVTPERGHYPIADLNESSPKTPSPFIDYVRRTIDETPYYRKEARRRFNPQNTY